MLEMAKERLKSFGYEWQEGDEVALAFSVQKVKNTVRNDCNTPFIPEGLIPIAVDMAVGEFLHFKMTFSPNDLNGFDLDFAIKEIKTGDTTTVFAVGEGSQTSEQRLSAFINYLLTYGRAEFSSFRRIRW